MGDHGVSGRNAVERLLAKRPVLQLFQGTKSNLLWLCIRLHVHCCGPAYTFIQAIVALRMSLPVHKLLVTLAGVYDLLRWQQLQRHEE